MPPCLSRFCPQFFLLASLFINYGTSGRLITKPIRRFSRGDAVPLLLIDPKAVLFLIGTVMDYKTDKLAAQFVFNNPNQTSACGCGESVKLRPHAEAAG